MGRPDHYHTARVRDLTPRQREVLALMAAGKTNGQIADTLGITIDGAKYHVSEILDRLEAGTREEAVAAWRAGRRPANRLRAALAAIVGKKLLAGGLAAAAVAAAGVGLALALRDDAGDSREPAPTAASVIAAAQRPGKILHLQMEMNGPDSGNNTHEIWYSSDLDAVRTESARDGALSDVTVIIPGRRASLWVPENQLADGPLTPDPADPLDPALGTVTHVALLARSDTVTYVGEETLDGQRLVRFDTTDVIDDGEAEGEQVVGTVNRASIYLRPGDLLPVRIDFETVVPGAGASRIRLTVRVAEFIGAATAPASLFDPAALAARVPGTADLLAIAAKQPFATFWLGARLEQPWHDPAGNGSNHQEVVLVHAPGAPTPWDVQGLVQLGYGPPAIPSLTLIDICQGPAGSRCPKDGIPLDLVVAAGNTWPLPSGEGFLFVEYQSAAGCSSERAQTVPACRADANGRWGAQLERDGTTILVTAAPKFGGPAGGDTNPFNSREAMTALLALLQPLP